MCAAALAVLCLMLTVNCMPFSEHSQSSQEHGTKWALQFPWHCWTGVLHRTGCCCEPGTDCFMVIL